MGTLEKIEKKLKSVSGIIMAVSSILGVLIGIFVAIIRLNNTVDKVTTMLPLVQEHSLFVSYEVDELITVAYRKIGNYEEIPREAIAKLLLYRDTLPKTLTYKQIMDINYIEKHTIYK